MKKRIRLMNAPTGHQPGNYIPKIDQAGRDPATPHLDLEITPREEGWLIRLEWPASHPIHDAGGNPGVFVDSAALLVPLNSAADWLTMGSARYPVEGLLWRANHPGLQLFTARGLGTTERTGELSSAHVETMQHSGYRRISLRLDYWQPLAEQRRLAVAVWQGHLAERAGFKSVTPGWVELPRE